MHYFTYALDRVVVNERKTSLDIFDKIDHMHLYSIVVFTRNMYFFFCHSQSFAFFVAWMYQDLSNGDPFLSFFLSILSRSGV